MEKLSKIKWKKRLWWPLHEKNESKIGDRVKIVETRPLSKDKHWRVAGVIERGEKSQQAIDGFPRG